MLLKALAKKLDLIQHNVHYGCPINKTLIPSYYRKKYGVNNLFRVELPQFWRMLYTLVAGGTEIEIIAFIVDVCDHSTYDQRFGYKK